MGFRFRKIINLGGFRINISKSGIGYSFGIPGMRYTKKTTGGTRKTFSIPGTGISYVKDSKKNKTKSITVEQNNEPKIYSEVIASCSNDLIDKMNQVEKKNKIFLSLKVLCGIATLIGFGFFYGWISETQDIVSGIVGLICLIGAIISFFFIPKSALIDLQYDFLDANSENNFKNLLSSINNLKCANKLWKLCSVETHNDWKNHAGAHSSVDRKSVSIEKTKLFNSVYDIKAVKAQNKKIIILPDIIAVYQNGTWIAVEWEHLNIEYSTTIFMESNSVPQDAEIVGYTYLHPNKDGSPDKRYSNNPQITKCRYPIIGLTSTNGLQEVFMISNKPLSLNFYNSLINIKNNQS